MQGLAPYLLLHAAPRELEDGQRLGDSQQKGHDEEQLDNQR